MSWSDNKELLSRADAILKFSIKKEKETSLHTQSACNESTIYIT